MTGMRHFNDAPILRPEDDRFGVDQFAWSVAKSFKQMESPVGVTIAINGSWGSGKSSAVNLICYHLQDEVKSGKLVLIDFKCWWFKGEEALTLAFLQTLNIHIKKSLSKQAKELIPRLGKTLLQAGPVVGPAMNLASGGLFGGITSGSMNFIKRFFPEGDSVETIFFKLSKALEDQEKRFLVIIDDIDRLTPDEAVLVFRLIKSVGRLPNVMYLLAFDRELAEKALTDRYPSEGPHFLEKIIQAGFDIPLPARDDLNLAALSMIETFCGPPSDNNQLHRFMNLFYDVISSYLNTPRDLVRLGNAMSVSWPPVANEVDVGDYVALEILKLFEPKLYSAIRSSKSNLCGVRSEYQRSEDPEQVIAGFQKYVDVKHHEFTKLALMRLFPRLENTVYSHSFIETWEAQRRLCAEKHFDTYFRTGIGDETLPISEIEEFIENAGSGDFVKQVFLKALNSVRKNGKSKVPLLFDEINVHAHRVDKSHLQTLISAIFEIADDIYREEDAEMGTYSIGDNHLRIHWLIRKLTLENWSLEERSSIFLAACEKAQVGWLVDFTRSAIGDHFPRNGREPTPPEQSLVSKDTIPELKQHALEIIRSAAVDGTILQHPRLPRILFGWEDFSEDGSSEVKDWSNEQLKIDESVSIFARAFTGESWSHGMGIAGLGDRVAMRNIVASVEGLEHIIDVEEFRRRLEELDESEDLDQDSKRDISVFLEAWRSKEKGR